MAKQFTLNTKGPIVDTKAGKLRGYGLDDLFMFKGIKYADAKRFRQPTPVESWEGVKDALWFTHVAPLLTDNSPNIDHMIPHRFWPESEDCLSLNVWTTSLDKNAKKAVMVWLHGGGYSAGSSIEMIAYEGDNMAKHGDVVVVTVNHRLNILGYFDLSSFGDVYKNSGNAGQADIVEALRWVRDNIANFGGDPGNVTIFGQSGGGGKVLSLVQTPEANGLFHKGILMSGGTRKPTGAPRIDREIAEALMKELGVNDVPGLEATEWDDLKRAVRKVGAAFAERGGAMGPGGGFNWSPVANDWYLGSPWDIGYTEHGKTIPLMVGSVIAEFSFAAHIPNKNEIPSSKRVDMIGENFGKEHAAGLIAAWKECYPDKNELGLLSLSNRMGILEFIRQRSEAHSSPVYGYLFSYDFPIDDGWPAWHCADIPYAFKNAGRVDCCNEPGVMEDLEAAYFGAYIAFAKTGSPNGPGLKEWPAFTAASRSTMFFDRVSGAAVDRDQKLMELHEKVAPDPMAAMRRRRQNITF